IAASVVSGAISEIDPTNVVLPTPKPPATMILTGIGASADAAGCAGASECLKAIEDPFQEAQVGAVPDVAGTVDGEEALLGEVTDDDAGHTEVDVEVGRDLGEGLRRDAER